jgi:hypothetical protein
MQTISMTVAASHPSTKRQRFSFYLRSNQSQTKTARSSTESEIIALLTALAYMSVAFSKSSDALKTPPL